MPLLPKRNSLDYNPDSVFNASKTIRTIALENMKNPVLDPDMKTLSAMDAEKNLSQNLDQLEEMYDDLLLSVNRLQTTAGFEAKMPTETQMLEGKGRFRGGASSASEMSGLSKSRFFDPPSKKKIKKPVSLVIVDSDDTEVIKPKRRGRPKGSKNKPKALPSGQTTMFQALPMYQAMAGTPAGSQMGSVASSSSSSRYSSQPVSSSGNSQATPYGDPDYDPDDDASSLPSSASVPSSRTSRRTRSGRSIPSIVGSIDENELGGDSYYNISMIGLLYGLISKINKMTFFVNSRIKPALRKLSAKQQGFLKSLQKLIFEFYNTHFRTPLASNVMYYGNLENYLTDPYVGVNNGDEILQQIQEALGALVLSLTITLNASIQAGDGETELSPADNYALRIAGFEGDPTGRMERATKMFPTPKQYMDITAPEARPLYRSEGLRRRAIPAPTARTLFGYGRKPMTGCGRNFYGDVINQTRDIPTIWTSVRNCPTKYLL